MKYILVSAFIIYHSGAFAKYLAIENCGSAKVASGKSCKDAKVIMDLSSCSPRKNDVEVEKLSCDGNNIKARFAENDYRYEAKFERIEDDWGGVEWKSLGAVQQWKKTIPLPKAITRKAASVPEEKTAPSVPEANLKKEVPTFAAITPVASKVPEPTAAASPTSLKFSGFFDFRMSGYGAEGQSTNSESGYNLEDGALYLNSESGKLTALLDIPFRRFKNSDNLSYVGTAGNTSPNGNFILGTDKAQAYLKYKFNVYSSAVAGQFDTPFGVEVNDSKDRFFGKTGLIYDLFLPVTHSGVLLEADYESVYFKVLSANPNNMGSLGTSPAGDENFEYGGALGYSSENLRGQVGYLVRAINHADSSAGGKRQLTDVILGTTINKFSFDIEFARVEDDNKNTLTAADNTDKEDAAYGYLGLLSYAFSEEFSLGLRYESVKNDPGQKSFKEQTGRGLALHYKVQSNLELRSEYVVYRSKNITDENFDAHRFNVASLFTF